MTSENKNRNKNPSEEGILTLDFIFSVMAVYAISMVFALLAFTLMFSSVVQYMAFSISRAHISGHMSPTEQQQAGMDRKAYLMTKYYNKFIKESDDGWFKIQTDGAANTYFSLSSAAAGSDRQKAYGVKVIFTANLLKKFKFPLLGSPSDGADDTFGVANIYSFLYREPSTQECLEFNKARWSVIRDRFPQITTMPGFVDKEYGAEADNGC